MTSSTLQHAMPGASSLDRSASPSSTSGESLTGTETEGDDSRTVDIDGHGRLSAGQPPLASTSASVVATNGSRQSGMVTTASSSSSSVTSLAIRRRHHNHSLALGTGAAKMGASITDSAQSTEDEGGDNEDIDTEGDNDVNDDIRYPALPTPTANSGAHWPFGVAASSSTITHAGVRTSSDTVRADERRTRAGSIASLTSSSTQYMQPPPSTVNAAFLPHEILLKILKNVRATQDLVNSLLVCKSWCQCGVELLWNKPLFPHVGPLIKMLVQLSRQNTTFPYASFIKRLNFSQLADRMSDTLLMRLAICDRLERLTLAGCTEISDDALDVLLKSCKNLVALDLSDCGRITDASLDVAAKHCRRLQGLNLSGCSLVTDAGIQTVATGCNMLRRMKLRNLTALTDSAIIALAQNCPLLLEVDLYTCTSITDRTTWALFRNCSHLRELSLNNCASVSGEGFPQRDGNLIYIKGSRDPDLVGKKVLNPKFAALTEGHHKKPPEYSSMLAHLESSTLLQSRLFEHVRYLDLTGLLGLTDRAMDGIVSTMPHIRNLVLAKCSNLTDDSINSICRLGKHIHFLHLGHVSSITDKAVTNLARSCTRLRYIDLACCPSLTDLSVFELAQNLPRLKRIGLVRVANLTDQAIFALAERTTLERIHLSYCEHVSVSAIQHLLERLQRLNHLSLTGVPAFRRADLQHFCRPPPKDFNTHQRSTFCVYSGKGVHELRKHLKSLHEQELRGGLAVTGHMMLNPPTGGLPPLQHQWVAYGQAPLATLPGHALQMHLAQPGAFHADASGHQTDEVLDDADEEDEGDEDMGEDGEDDRGGQSSSRYRQHAPSSHRSEPVRANMGAHDGHGAAGTSSAASSSRQYSGLSTGPTTRTSQQIHDTRDPTGSINSVGAIWPGWLPSSVQQAQSSAAHGIGQTHSFDGLRSPLNAPQASDIRFARAPAHQPRENYLDVASSPGQSGSSSSGTRFDDHHIPEAHWLDMAGFRNMLDANTLRAAQEQDEFDRQRAISSTNGTSNDHAMEGSTSQASAQNMQSRADRPRRDTIRQSTFGDSSRA